METGASPGEDGEQPGISREGLFVRGDDGGSAVERGMNPVASVRCSACLDDDVDRRVGGERRCVARDRRCRRARVTQLGTRDGNARESKPDASDRFQGVSSFGERRRERGSNGAAADEAEAYFDGCNTCFSPSTRPEPAASGTKKSPRAKKSRGNAWPFSCLFNVAAIRRKSPRVDFDCDRMSKREAARAQGLRRKNASPAVPPRCPSAHGFRLPPQEVHQDELA
jgi:hypothetical protein